MNSAAEQLFDATVRVEAIIWIPGAVADPECSPDSFRRDFCEYLPTVAAAQLYGALPQLAKFASEDVDPDPENVAYALLHTAGFLVQGAGPVKRYYNEGACEYSWGIYRTCWLYAPSEKDIPTVLLAWSEQNDLADRAKYSQSAA